MRRRNSMASLGRVLDSQSQSSDRDDEDLDSVSGSRPSSLKHADADLTTAAAAAVNANGSVPCAAGTDNIAFDQGAEKTDEKRSETTEKQGVETVTAEVTGETGAGSVMSPARARGKHPLTKRVSFVDFDEEPERNQENSTEQQ